MIKHVVMWKFCPGTEAEQARFLEGLRGLYGVIPQIREQEVGMNCAGDRRQPGGGELRRGAHLPL